jgi:hypothetical protein
MNSNSGSQQNNYSYKNKINIKDDIDMTNVNQSDLLIFLQFYFTNAQKNLTKILSDKILMNDSEIYKITSSFNFWLNFSLNFKDTSFVDLLLNKEDDRAKFSKDKLLEIIKIIVKFLYENLNSEEAFNRMMKNNYQKLYELILKFKDIIDNVYNSKLRDEIFTHVSEENNNSFKEEEAKNEVCNGAPALLQQKDNEKKDDILKLSKMMDNNESIQFTNNVDLEKVNNIVNNNINIINQNNKINDAQIEKNEKTEKIISNKINQNENGINDTTNNNNNNNNNKCMLINEEIINENNTSNNNINSEASNNSNNIVAYKVNSFSLDYAEIEKLFFNFCFFTKFNLRYFQIVFYEKVGYAFLTYSGDFLWADEYTTYVLFEEENVKKINLFNIMTDFSKYILKKKFKDHFFDFKDENNRLRVFTYTIDGAKTKEQENKKKGEKLFEDLSKIKTLVSRASPVLLNSQGDNYMACIFLETKFSIFRQNFDFFYWKSDWNNK